MIRISSWEEKGTGISRIEGESDEEGATGVRGLMYSVSWGRIGLQRAFVGLSGSLARLRFREIWEPEGLPQGWTPVRPRLSGICGSDITLLKGHVSPYFRPMTSFPAVLGHEILANTSDGTRVVVIPTLSCQSRRLPPCAYCVLGQPEDCLRRADPGLGAGLMLGYHRRLPGGWGEMLWAPEEQLVRVPDAMPDERAVLAEPGAVVLAGLRRLNWAVVKEVLVIGAGTLGQLATAMISELYPAATISVLAKYPTQAQVARAMGARYVDGIERVTGAPLPTLRGFRPFYPRGFDAVVVTAGSPRALADAIGWVAPGGQSLLLGGVSQASFDATPLWARHVTLVGSYGYGDGGSDTFRAVLSLYSVMHQPLETLVTHQFRLSEYKAALNQVLVQRQGVIKAAFRVED